MYGFDAVLLVLLLGDPHLFKSVQRSQDGPADPGGIESLLRRRHADLNVFGGESLDFGQESVAEPLEERGPAAEDDVGVESPADVDGAVLDDLVHRLGDRRHEVGVRELKLNE